MADYGININVRTKDEKLKQLQKTLTTTEKKVKALQKELDQLSKKTGKGPGSGGPFSKDAIAKAKELTQKTKEAQIAFEKYTKGLLNYEGANRKGIASTRELATRMKELAASSGITSQKFELFTQGFTKLNFSAQIKSLQRFNESAKITASTFGAMGSKDVPGVTGFSNADISTLLNFTPANTINAIERYLDTLTGVRKQLDFTEKEYGDVTARIKEMNKELEKQRTLIRDSNKEDKTASRLRRGRARDSIARKEARFDVRFARFRRNQTATDKAIRDQATSSAIIGGAFPLLFGQGLGASIGGGFGGFAGGIKGGQFGFALSLLGTQIGAFFDGLSKKAIELGDALRKPSENIDILVQRAGISGSALERQISKLEELGLQATAADIALAEIDEFADVEQLKKLSKSFQELSNTFAKVNTQLLSFVSQGLGELSAAINEILQGISGAFSLADIANQVPKDRRKEFQKRIGELIPESLPQGGLDFIDPLRKGNLQRALNLGSQFLTPSVLSQLKEEFVPSSAPAKVQISQELLDSARSVKIDNLKSEIELEAQRLTQRSEEQDVIRKTNEIKKIESQIALKQFELDKTEEGVRKDKLEDQLEELRLQRELNIAQLRNAEILANPVQSAIVDLNNELRDLMDTQKQLVELSKSIGDSFSSSFKGIVNGSMTAQQALANLFQRTADHFLDMAAQMIAKQIQMRILGIGLRFFGGGGETDVFAGFNRGPTDPNTLTMESFANGGRPPVDRPSLVGERGPELFVPDTAGTIIPNHQMGGTTSVVVNVDASGTSVEGDQPNAEELGRLIGAVVQSELIKEKRPGGLLA
jgi:hypothetical protein